MLVTHDFAWEEHAYALLQRFYPAACTVLDDEFRTTFNLTYGTFGGPTGTGTGSDDDGEEGSGSSSGGAGGAGTGIDTEPFRTAIWYYIQRLYGICNDHYDYRQVNAFMTIATKGFVKKAACYPEIITKVDFDSFTTTFTPDEKVHIVLLAAEARRQAALLYGLRAIMKHMSGH